LYLGRRLALVTRALVLAETLAVGQAADEADHAGFRNSGEGLWP